MYPYTHSLSAISREAQHSILYVKQLPVKPFHCQQIVMGTTFDNASTMQHEDFIHAFHPQQAMRDLQGGTSPREFTQGIKQHALDQGTEVGCGFIENEDGRVFQ